MVGVEIKITATGFEKPIAVFDKLSLGDFSEFMKVVAETMYRQTLRHFTTKVGPGGAWAPLSEATVHGVMGKPGRAQGTMLIDSGALMGSIQQEAGPLTARVGTNLFYGKFHQEGTGPTGPGHRFSGIPARQFVGLTGEDESELSQIIDDYFQRLLS